MSGKHHPRASVIRPASVLIDSGNPAFVHKGLPAYGWTAAFTFTFNLASAAWESTPLATSRSIAAWGFAPLRQAKVISGNMRKISPICSRHSFREQIASK